MTEAEAIEILSRPFDMKNVPQDILEAHKMAIAALEKQEGKKSLAIKTNIYDTEEIHHNCTDSAQQRDRRGERGLVGGEGGGRMKDYVLREAFQEIIKDIPAADVVEVRHGRWVLFDNALSMWNVWVCSECGYRRKEGWMHTEAGKKPEAQYCENCMAKMDGGADK